MAKNKSLIHFVGIIVILVLLFVLLYTLYNNLFTSSCKQEGLENKLGDYQNLVGGQGPKFPLPWKKMPYGYLCDPPLGKGIGRHVKSESECLAAFRKQYGAYAKTGTLE